MKPWVEHRPVGRDILYSMDQRRRDQARQHYEEYPVSIKFMALWLLVTGAIVGGFAGILWLMVHMPFLLPAFIIAAAVMLISFIIADGLLKGRP